MDVIDEIVVSIITIAYNAETSIERTIRSVLVQGYSHIEYIVIDGKSTDDTLKVINKYKENVDIVISEKDRGISDAFNKGLRYAHGDLVIFLNAGDTFINERVVEKVAGDWDKSRPDVIFYKVKVGDHTLIPPDSMDNKPEKVWRSCEVPHQGAFVKRELFNRMGAFNICLKMRMDYDFWARCMREDCSYLYIPEIIVNYEQGGASMQLDNAGVFYREGLGIKLIYHLPVNCMDILQLIMPKKIRKLIRIFIKR